MSFPCVFPPKRTASSCGRRKFYPTATVIAVFPCRTAGGWRRGVTLATAYDSEIALDGQPHAGWSWEISLDEAVLAEAIRRGPLEL